MATITSAGIGSGLDVNSIVSQLVALEKRPLENLQRRAEGIQTKISTYGQIKSQYQAVADAASKLRLDSTWNSLSVKSTNATAVNASVSGVAQATSFSVEVQQLARGQNVSSAVFADGDPPGTGTLRIQLGKYDYGTEDAPNDPPLFTAGSSAEVSIEIDASDDSLSAVAAKINDADAGVTATVLTDANGQRLLLRSKATGEEQAFRVQVDDDDGTPNDEFGLSRLAFDPEGFTLGLNLSPQGRAQDALATLNGVPVRSTTNSLVNTVPGLTINLSQVTTSPVEISTAADTGSIRSAIDAFIKAYNELNRTLLENTRYEESTKTAGLLQGDSTAVSLRNTLRALVTSNNQGSPFSRLSDIGISLDREGNMSLSGSRLDAAFKDNFDGLKALFAADTGNEQTNGFGLKVRNFATSILSFEGVVNNRTAALQRSIDNNQKDQDRINERAARVEARLKAQYTALDVKVGQLTALSNYVSQQFGASNSGKTK
jgi:flagellar hook-associated protein 2